MPEATALRINRRAPGIGTRPPDRPAGSDGGVDDLGHLHHVERVGRLVLDIDAEVLGRLIDAVLDHRPERVGGLPVADHDDAHVLGERTAGQPIPAARAAFTRCADAVP
jgi:hypothetical protein